MYFQKMFGFANQEKKNAPEGIRTPNLRFRRPTLYPIELRVLYAPAGSPRQMSA